MAHAVTGGYGTYRPGQRGWIEVKNPAYWRRDQEIEENATKFADDYKNFGQCVKAKQSQS